MNNEKYKNYLHDLGGLLKEKAIEAKFDKKNSFELEERVYKTGYLMAFHEVIDLMKQQAMAFGIEQKDIGLAGIDADLDLL